MKQTRGTALRKAFDWAYARHTNKASWYIRPLWVLPLGYSAWRRSWPGIGLSLAGLVSSMFWFPKPDEVDPKVQGFLDMEKEFLLNLTPAKAVSLSAIPIKMTMLLTAFWHRSLGWGLVVVNQIAVLKVIWSIRNGGESGRAVVVPAVIGLIVCNGVVIGIARWQDIPITLRLNRGGETR